MAQTLQQLSRALVLLWPRHRVNTTGVKLASAIKSALVTGITGQDGGHIARLLHENGCDIYGLIRGQRNPHKAALERDHPDVKLIESDLADATARIRAVEVAIPAEIYNLAAVRDVGCRCRVNTDPVAPSEC